MNYNFSIKDAMDLAAKKTAVEGWQAWKWESITGGHLVTGEVPNGTYTRGPGKGQPRFGQAGAQHKQRVIVSEAELQAVAAAHEAETGECWDCKGTGKTWAGWSAKEGVTYRPCKRCGASGKAHNARVQPP